MFQNLALVRYTKDDIGVSDINAEQHGRFSSSQCNV
jgi:hypothetical protein